MVKQYSALAAMLLWSSMAATSTHAQNASRVANQVLGTDGQPELVQFSAEGQAALRGLSGDQVLRQQLGLTTADQLVQRSAETDQLGMVHQKFGQFYQGIPVEHASYTVHSKGGVIESISGDFERITNLNITPSLSATAALGRALAHVGARTYMWQTNEANAASFVPTGALVVVRDYRVENGPQVLAWKFNVYAAAPISRAYVYVDAHTGDVVLTDNIIKHAAATGTFATAYSGTRPTADGTTTGGYYLRETTRGNGIQTFNCKRSNSYTAAVDFVDADNNWTAAEYNNANFDNVAGDAHVGAQATYDYWKNVHGRNSYDNAGAAIKSYVHYDDVPGGAGYENAYWNGSVMTYGDGATRFRPLTSLDVCGHEIGHAVCEKTANLTYSNESGAMNEGLSDCWGASIEAYAVANLGFTSGGVKAKDTWLIGEEIDKQQAALRSMSAPNTQGQPAYYKGTYWYTGTADNGGVHTNSGVLNYWYYLISVGKTGTNEKGVSFSVGALGLDAAAKILFRTESVYMTAGSTYANARTYSIKAAQDLYGVGSAQEQSVTNAWFAVGIGAAYSGGTPTGCGVPSSVTASSITNTGATISWASVSGATSYNVQYRVSGATAWTTTSSSSTSKALTGLTASTTYQYQVQSVCASGSSAYSATASFATTGGTTPPPSSYCVSKGSSQTYEYISKVQLGSINRTSGSDAGYYNGSALSTTVAAGSSQTVSLGTNSTYTENWGIYVDWNQNGTFEAAERMDYGSLNSTTLTSTWTVPATAKNGTTRMRIVMTYGAATTACGTYSYGETEDYSLTITGGTFAPNASASLAGPASKALDAQLSVYPNPASSVLNLALPGNVAITSVVVTDVRGARVAGAELSENTLNVSSLAKGMYTLTVSDGVQTYYQRFVKE